MYLKYNICTILFLLVISNCLAQNSEVLTRAYFEQIATANNFSSTDISEWIIKSESTSSNSKIHHIYGTQLHNGIEIYAANFGLHIINENEVVKFNNTFVSGLAQKAQFAKSIPQISAIQAVQYGIDDLNLNNTKAISVTDSPFGQALEQKLSAPGISNEPIPAKLMYFKKANGELTLVWGIEIGEFDGKYYWSLKVDAATGKILDKINLVISCSFGEHNHSEIEIEHTYDNSPENKFTPFVGGYNVYPLPIESPNHGGRRLITNPDDATASPFGWHDTNGRTGSEFTITRGNNAFAYDDDDNNNTPGFSPNGGDSLTFTFPINTTYSASNQSEAAAITNLFYWNNIIHDIWYHYGFDEASGNFQENNYGRGGVGGDSINAEAQDGSGTCNANFLTRREGVNSRMQMYVCRSRDGDLA